MATDDVSESEEAARQWLRRKWRDKGDTDAISCPSCGAREIEWEFEDETVRVRCRQCSYDDARRYASE